MPEAPEPASPVLAISTSTSVLPAPLKVSALPVSPLAGPLIAALRAAPE